MSITSDYRYDLRVFGADDAILDQFKAALAKTPFNHFLEQDPVEPDLFTTEVWGSQGGMYEEDVQKYLHGLALQFPQLKLTLTAMDISDGETGYELTFQGNMFQRSFPEIVWSDPFPPVPFVLHDRGDMFRQAMKRHNEIHRLTEEVVYGTDYDLLYAQKLTLLEHLATGKPIPKPALEGLINLLDTMGDLGETLGRFQYDGIEPPYGLNPEYQKKICVFEPEPQPKVHALCEEYEDGDGIREFKILALSHDEDALRNLMQAKIREDEYGLIAKNGVDEDLRDNHFMTNFCNGFVEYYIVEEEVLNKEQIQSMIRASEPELPQPSERGPSLAALISDASQRSGKPSEQHGRSEPLKDTPEK